MMTDLQVLERVRALCVVLPECVETVSLGHPTFKAGRKTFAVLETLNGRRAVLLHPGGLRLAELLRDPAFFVPPHVGRKGWVAVEIQRNTPWPLLGDLLKRSYRRVALKRMLDQLDGLPLSSSLPAA
jgi:predicted DNA-binding protein (MmcQ/YjbR family)